MDNYILSKYDLIVNAFPHSFLHFIVPQSHIKKLQQAVNHRSFPHFHIDIKEIGRGKT